MKSKRFEVLSQRPVNQDGYVKEWVEEGFIAMESPQDPKPSIRIENGKIVELDGKRREDFDLIDTFIANYAIRLERAEEVMAMDSREIANKILTPSVPRSEIASLAKCMTPAKMLEVVSQMNVVEMMQCMQKMRARRTMANQAHVTNVNDNPVQIAADAAEDFRIQLTDNIIACLNLFDIKGALVNREGINLANAHAFLNLRLAGKHNLQLRAALQAINYCTGSAKAAAAAAAAHQLIAGILHGLHDRPLISFFFRKILFQDLFYFFYSVRILFFKIHAFLHSHPVQESSFPLH